MQKNKPAALAMVHGLMVPVGLKKKFRHWIQHTVLQREHYQHADNDYFRKAIRANELFYKLNLEQLGQLVTDNDLCRNKNTEQT